jgi:hypothetical protein
MIKNSKLIFSGSKYWVIFGPFQNHFWSRCPDTKISLRCQKNVIFVPFLKYKRGMFHTNNEVKSCIADLFSIEKIALTFKDFKASVENL